jgi:hypothetical protein
VSNATTYNPIYHGPIEPLKARDLDEYAPHNLGRAVCEMVEERFREREVYLNGDPDAQERDITMTWRDYHRVQGEAKAAFEVHLRELQRLGGTYDPAVREQFATDAVDAYLAAL